MRLSSEVAKILHDKFCVSKHTHLLILPCPLTPLHHAKLCLWGLRGWHISEAIGRVGEERVTLVSLCRDWHSVASPVGYGLFMPSRYSAENFTDPLTGRYNYRKKGL